LILDSLEKRWIDFKRSKSLSFNSQKKR